MVWPSENKKRALYFGNVERQKKKTWGESGEKNELVAR